MDILDLFSRRNLLLGLGGTAAAAAFAGAAGAKVVGRTVVVLRRTVALRSAGYADWSAQVGSNFTAHTGHVLRLVDVHAYPRAGSRPRGVRTQGFVARFDIIRGGALPAGRYLVAHPGGGTFQIFLTKGGPDKPRRMLADFN